MILTFIGYYLSMNENALDFWNRVDEILVKKSESLVGISRKIGVAYQTLINQKCQDRYPSIPVAMRIADELGCTLNYLLTGEEIKPVSDTVKKIVERLLKSNTNELEALGTILKI